MSDLSWQYTSLGLVLVCMGRAKTTIELITKSCTDKKLQGWRSVYIDKFMQVSFQSMHLFQGMVDIGSVIINNLKG